MALSTLTCDQTVGGVIPGGQPVFTGVTTLSKHENHKAQPTHLIISPF